MCLHAALTCSLHSPLPACLLAAGVFEELTGQAPAGDSIELHVVDAESGQPLVFEYKHRLTAPFLRGKALRKWLLRKGAAQGDLLAFCRQGARVLVALTPAPVPAPGSGADDAGTVRQQRWVRGAPMWGCCSVLGVVLAGLAGCMQVQHGAPLSGACRTLMLLLLRCCPAGRWQLR